MSRDLNKVQIIGRITKDLEVRDNNGTSVANFSVATNYTYRDSSGEQQEKPEFHNLVVWGKLADVCGQYLQKGSRTYFEGRLQTRKWEDKEGKTRYSTEVVVSEMIMLDGKVKESIEDEEF